MAARDHPDRPVRYFQSQRVRGRRRLAILLAAAFLAVVALSEIGGSAGPVALAPNAFARGACIAYPPTSGNRHKTVFLDPGHGGIDPGGVGTTDSGQPVEEAKVNLPIAFAAMALLRANGFRVVLSRTGDSTVVRLSAAQIAAGTLSYQAAHADVADRDVCANLGHAKVLVGIYMDAGGPQSAGSLTAYDPDRPFAGANRRFANLLQADVLSAMNGEGWAIPSDGVRSDSGEGSYQGSAADGGVEAGAASYDHLLLLGPAMAGYFSTPSHMPGAVIEPLYLTDPFEGSLAASRHGQKVIARGIASAVEQFLAPTSK
jgi:N-acetylmuramoyl-L-alanine amidase